MPEVQVRSELACERPHRVILRSGRNAQARVALASCFRDEPPEQIVPTPCLLTEASTLNAISGSESGD